MRDNGKRAFRFTRYFVIFAFWGFLLALILLYAVLGAILGR